LVTVTHFLQIGQNRLELTGCVKPNVV